MMKMISLRNLLGATCAAAALLVAGCGGGGGGGGSSGSSTTPTTPTTTTKPVASILLTATPSKIKSDGSDSTTLTATALDADHAAVSKAEISFKADSGALSAGTVTAGTDGKATVTYTAGSADPTSRTATVTAGVGTVTQQIPIIITGATVAVATSTSNLTVGGATATLTVTLKDASNSPLTNTTVSLASAGTGSVSLSPETGKTDNKGQFISTISGATPGTAQVTVSAAGEKATSSDFTITATPGAAFSIISHPSKKAAASLGVPVTVEVQAPSAKRVTFVSSLGSWDGTGNSITKVVSSGSASANLTASSAGIATVQIYDADKPSTVDTMTVAFTASLASASKITIQATPTVVPQSTGGTSGVSTLIATVTDASGNPVGDAPVAFEIIKNTGGGETISPAVILTASTAGNQVLGQANAIFTSGSLPSTTGGVVIRASVVGSSLKTGTSPSGNDASLTIGGTAGSVSIGRATVIKQGTDNAYYILPMSVVVADSNGNAVAGAKVSLSAFPIAFNAGGVACRQATTTGVPRTAEQNAGVDYFNEDADEDQVLDAGEDGVRKTYPAKITEATPGTPDGQLTPPNSASGTLPPTVTTDANGVTTFNLTYTKSSALWISTRIRASVIVLGTETVGETVFRLPAEDSDLSPCRIPDSPYQY